MKKVNALLADNGCDDSNWRKKKPASSGLFLCDVQYYPLVGFFCRVSFEYMFSQ